MKICKTEEASIWISHPVGNQSQVEITKEVIGMGIRFELKQIRFPLKQVITATSSSCTEILPNENNPNSCQDKKTNLGHKNRQKSTSIVGSHAVVDGSQNNPQKLTSIVDRHTVVDGSQNNPQKSCCT